MTDHVTLTRLPGGPPGVLDYLGTENANGEPSLEFADRRSRCYELATYAVALSDHELVEKARLVHGSWKHADAPERIGHAWVEVPTVVSSEPLIWEPITAGLYEFHAFFGYTNAWAERTYDVTTARRMLASHGHYGRWHESRYP